MVKQGKRTLNDAPVNTGRNNEGKFEHSESKLYLALSVSLTWPSAFSENKAFYLLKVALNSEICEFDIILM